MQRSAAPGYPFSDVPMRELLAHAEAAASRVSIGRDYPGPIVPHAEARRRAIERFAEARG